MTRTKNKNNSARVKQESTLVSMSDQINPNQSMIVLSLGFLAAFLLGLFLWSLTAGTLGSTMLELASAAIESQQSVGDENVPVVPPSISSIYTPEVRYWEPQILAWSAMYDLDPNLVATVMQIESCGNPEAVSRSGAQGLFQVMPFHFAEGENMLDPDTNAQRGLNYLVNSLKLTNGHIGMALAGYNGGHLAAEGTWASWNDETKRYYRWGNGIYQDAISGLDDSPTLHDWLAAGGSSLCTQAAAQLAME